MSFLDTAKDAYELAKKGMTIEFQEKLMELREEALQLQEDNFRLRTRVRELEEKLDHRESMVFRETMYFRVKGDTEDGPFCSKCYDDRGKFVRLHAIGDRNTVWTHHCPACDDCFGRKR